MLDLNEAIRLAKDARSAAQAQRAWYDTFWTMQLNYAYGQQWGYTNFQSSGNSNEIRFLKSIIDPQREDVRVAINRIHPDIVRTAAALAPKQIIFDMEAPITGKVVKFVGEKLLQRHLKDIRAIDALRDANLVRLTLGSSIIRRTLTTQGAPIAISDNGPAIRNIRPGLALVNPYQIIRDPSAVSLRWDTDETIFGQEQPQTTAWVKRNFGVEIKTEATMGSLSDYQRQLSAATGAGGRFMHDSKMPAVVIYEFYFKDPDVPPKIQKATGGWPFVLFAYTDMATDRGEMIPLGTNAFTKNPFYGNPYHGRHYSRMPNAPWARGIPHLQTPAQDCLNIAVTHYMRIMQQSSGKWRYEEGTISPTEVSRMLGPDLRTPIAWKRAGPNSQAPDRVPAPQINPAAAELLTTMPGWMREAVGLNGIQFGDVSKRGESGDAIESRLSEANAPLEAIRDEDDEELARMLLGMTYDLGGNTRLDELDDRLGESCSMAQKLEFLREPVSKHIVAVNIHPAVHRPKTQGENREDYLQLAGQKIMEPKDAIWNLMLANPPVIIDDEMYRAYQHQMVEVESMKAGEEVEVMMTDFHAYHRRTLKRICNDPSFRDLPPEVQDALQQHDADHMQAMILESQGLQMAESPNRPGQPSAPGEAFREPAGEPVGAAAP
jgi:hypothetical protein